MLPIITRHFPIKSAVPSQPTSSGTLNRPLTPGQMKPVVAMNVGLPQTPAASNLWWEGGVLWTMSPSWGVAFDSQASFIQYASANLPGPKPGQGRGPYGTGFQFVTWNANPTTSLALVATTPSMLPFASQFLADNSLTSTTGANVFSLPFGAMAGLQANSPSGLVKATPKLILMGTATNPPQHNLISSTLFNGVVLNI